MSRLLCPSTAFSRPVALFDDRQAGLVVGLVGGSHVMNHMYFMLLPPIVPLLGRDLGLSAGQVGIAIGLLGLMVTGLQLPFGHLSDTKGRTPMLAVSLGFGAVGALLTATAQSYAWLLGAQVITGIGIAGHHPAHYPLLSQATAESARGRAFSIHGFTGAIGFAAPPAIIAGAGLFGVGWRSAIWSIALLGGMYGLLAVWLLARRVDPTITAPSDTSQAGVAWNVSRVLALPRRAGRGLRKLLSSRGIVLITILWFVTSMAAWGIKSQTLPLLIEGYGLTEGAGNAIVSAMLVLGAVLMLGGGWLVDRTSPTLVLAVGYTAFVALTAALASGLLPVVLAVGFALGLAATIDYSRPARAALADRLSSSDSLGKSFGLVTIGISGGSAVAPPVLGVMADTWSIETSFLAMAGLGLLSLGLLAVVVRWSGARAMARPQPGD
jgi:MFS family permease